MESILNEIIIVPKGGGTVYVNEVVEINNSHYAVCTPLVHTDSEQVKQEISRIKEHYGDLTVIYIYKVYKDQSESIVFENPRTEDLHELIAKIKEMDFLGETTV
ncbi:hypothetical protein LIS04_21 [Listeria phage LIS04]|nr:hypothetical protein LIS04_21 [Listeria phage LIS04]